MSPLSNAPERFAAEMLAGFADAHRDRVRAVPGGVVRATPSPPGKVAVVTGGGSGHYPAFVGLVGHGMADGAAAGEVFASPSAQQIVRVARAAEHGGGILFAFGNYAGDVLNFRLAADQLRKAGVDVRVLPITDDLASAGVGCEAQRRGIAGALVVYKVAGAAAEAGRSLDEVERLAGKANDRTRSLGVAFAGCTVPGATGPLFALPEATLALGMGIHGEPGIRTEPLPSADDLADLLVDQVLAEAPPGADGRVAAVLNGLGGTRYEELFVLWRRVAERLAGAGLTVVGPEVGELTTSLDMAGCSLSVCWLDDELTELWLSPADSPAYRRGQAAESAIAVPAPAAGDATETPEAVNPTNSDNVVSPVSTVSRQWARRVLAAFDAMAAVLRSHEDYLGQLDAVAGDGDHGRGMTRGCEAARDAARAAIEAGAGVRGTVLAAAESWADKAGGTSGVLWGQALREFGSELDDQTAPGGPDIARAVAAALAGVTTLGGAVPGDKTIVDGLDAFSVSLSAAIAAGESLETAWGVAAKAATAQAEATAAMTPRKGRARPLAALSVGTPDPGAVSLALCVDAIDRQFGETRTSCRSR
ncbi:MAG TPA: dihydroxyacetone kinase family protein [Pseudonocardiaceae bacterium]|nr:dihydroxyacetone kinase family protein [Pseudonocardiaceae bacterium]